MTTSFENARRMERVLEDYMLGRVVLTARRLGVFRALAPQPLTLEQLAQQLQLAQREMLRKMLDVLERAGWIEQACDGPTSAAIETRPKDHVQAARYQLSEAGAATLVADGEQDFSGVLDFFSDQFEAKDERALQQYMQSGELLRPGVTDKHWQRYMRAMANMAHLSADSIARAVELENATRLLDLAGGPGHYSAAFCRHYPQLHVTLLDLDTALAVAARNLAAADVRERVDLCCGSITDEIYGREFDAVFLSHTIHLFDASLVQQIFQRSFGALKPGGVLIVRDLFLEGTRPLLGCLIAWNMWIEGDAYQQSDVIEWLRATGFAGVQPRSFASDDCPHVLGSLIVAAKK